MSSITAEVISKIFIKNLNHEKIKVMQIDTLSYPVCMISCCALTGKGLDDFVNRVDSLVLEARFVYVESYKPNKSQTVLTNSKCD